MRRFVLSLAAAVILAIPAVSAFAQNLTVINVDGYPVTLARYGVRYTSSLSPSNSETIRLSDGSLGEVWMFEGFRGDCAQLTMRSSAVDSYLVLRTGAPFGTQVASNDDGAGGLDARIVYSLPSAGRYYVTATSYGAGQSDGRYTLDVERC